MRPGTELEHPRQGRAPQHERGRRRVDAILDAASALLVEGGLAAVSVDAVAKRSRTSKSSMYHFFPDRDAIVRALADRHVAAITATGEGFETVDAPSWARATVEQVVDRYIAQFARYVAAHPDVLLCMQANAGLSGAESAEAGLEAMALKRAEFVGGARLPHARPAERRAPLGDVVRGHDRHDGGHVALAQRPPVARGRDPRVAPGAHRLPRPDRGGRRVAVSGVEIVAR